MVALRVLLPLLALMASSCSGGGSHAGRAKGHEAQHGQGSVGAAGAGGRKATEGGPTSGGTPAGTTSGVPILPGWPGPDNTGVPAGVSLTPSGPLTVSTPGAVIDALDVSGGIVVRANDVTIKRTRVRSGGRLIFVARGVVNLVIEDVELDGLNAAPAGVQPGHYTARRVNIHNTHDGLKLGDDTIVQDSFVHDLFHCATCHNDGSQGSGPAHDVRLVHNTILNPGRPGAVSAINLDTQLGAISDVVIDDNFLDGGAHTLYLTDKRTGYGPPTSVTLRDNRFGRHFRFDLGRIDADVQQSGNTWADGTPISDVTGTR